MPAKKKNTGTSKPTTTIRYASDEERSEFTMAAKAEGFTTVAAWMMYHLRNHARETMERIKSQGH